ncbi:hypothetical protein ACP4OV_002608 [Aristida adscensionis]
MEKALAWNKQVPSLMCLKADDDITNCEALRCSEADEKVSAEEALGENLGAMRKRERQKKKEQRALFSASITDMLARRTTMTEAEKKLLHARHMYEWDAMIAKEEKSKLEIGDDYESWRASRFFAGWSGIDGSFEDITKLPPMRFTDEPARPYEAAPLDALQIFSVKVAGIRGGLKWPLDVFGLVAVRDIVDKKRNVIFNRTRDSCQTLTKKDPYLALTGPTRAVVWLDPVTIEVKLTVKGTTESNDKDLSFLAVPLACSQKLHSYSFITNHTSRLSTLDFTLGHIVDSVEATIFVQVTAGSWPDGFCGQFAALTIGTCAGSIDHEEIILLDSGGEKMPASEDGQIMLSRRVVSVEIRAKLKFRLKAWQDDNCVVKEKVFSPLQDGRTDGMLRLGGCAMKVTVAWSLLSWSV